MPLLYGEGDRAFHRPHEEIVRTSIDHSIFCWQASQPDRYAWRGLFARSSSQFNGSRALVEMDSVSASPYQQTNKDLRLQLIVGSSREDDGRFVSLDCSDQTSRQTLGIWVHKVHGDEYVRVRPDIVLGKDALKNSQLYHLKILRILFPSRLSSTIVCGNTVSRTLPCRDFDPSPSITRILVSLASRMHFNTRNMIELLVSFCSTSNK